MKRETEFFTLCPHCGNSTEMTPAGRCLICGELKILPKPETINHPSHYGGANNPYEAIKVIEAWGLGFCLGNTIKYISRAGKKGGADNALEDLKKAAWYLQREIETRSK